MKTKAAPAKKATRKQSRYYLVRTAREARKDIRKRVVGVKRRANSLKTDTRKGIDEWVEAGKRVYSGIEGDARRLVTDLVDRSKNSLDKVPGPKRVEQSLDRGIKAIPKQLNLPSKDQIDALNDSLKALQARIETMSQQQAA